MAMDLTQVEGFMAEMGISHNPANLAAVIRFVQRAERRFDCFGTARGFCDQSACAWRQECIEPRVVLVPARRSELEVRHPRLCRGHAAPSSVESEQPILPTA